MQFLRQNCQRQQTGMVNVVLVEPEIPQNTGNVARTCACTGCALHLVKPFGFEISDRTVKRAGLDYWDKVEIYYYDSLEDFLRKHSGDKLFFLTTKAKKEYLQRQLSRRLLPGLRKGNQGTARKIDI